ncbi:hypothetical protein WMY97_07720 [Vibrio diabolicus]
MESLTLTTQDIDLILEGTFLYAFFGMLAALLVYDVIMGLGKGLWRAFKK